MLATDGQFEHSQFELVTQVQYEKRLLRFCVVLNKSSPNGQRPQIYEIIHFLTFSVCDVFAPFCSILISICREEDAD